MVVGAGVNMLTGQTTTQVFSKLQTTTTSSPSLSQQQVCIQTSDDYASLLDVTGAAEGQAWTEGGQVTVSASTSFLREQKFNAQSLSFICHKSVTTVSELPSASTLETLQLPADVSSRIIKDPQGFLNAYGTHFIAGFVYGGSFVGSIQIEAVSESDLQTIKATFATEINDFDIGKAKIDASFKQNLQSAAQTHQYTINTGANGVNPPVYDDSTVDNIQDYMDNHFVTDLGTGVPLMAVCYPGESLPCVMNLPGYTSGTLSPAIDLGALNMLRNEYRRLSYAVQTAVYMQNNNIFVSPASAKALQADLAALYQVQGQIAQLDFSDLQKLDQNSVQQYLVSVQYLNDLNEIASSRAAVSWTLQLDGAFTPNTQGDPGRSQTGQTIASPTSAGTPTFVVDANHGDGQLSVGFLYQLIPVATGQQPPTALQDQVQLTAYMKFNNDVYQGTPRPRASVRSAE